MLFRSEMRAESSPRLLHPMKEHFGLAIDKSRFHAGAPLMLRRVSHRSQLGMQRRCQAGIGLTSPAAEQRKLAGWRDQRLEARELSFCTRSFRSRIVA